MRPRTRSRRARFLLAASVVCASSTAASAAVRTWNAGSGNFNVAGNWTGGVPGVADTANFNLGTTYTVTFDLSPTNLNVTQSAGTVTFRPDTVASRTYTLSGSGGVAVSLTGGSLTLGAPATGSNILALSMGTNALNIQGGSLTVANNNDITAVGNILLQNASLSSTLNVGGSGSGSVITQSGAATLTVGGAAGTGLSNVNVFTGGQYTGGTGLTTINPTGTLTIAGGTFTANADVLVDGGSLSRGILGGTFNLGGNDLTVQNNGLVGFLGTQAINGGTALTVQTGADASFVSLDVGNSVGSGSVLVDGSGSSLGVSSTLNIGTNNGGASIVTVQNSATATLGTVNVGPATAGAVTAQLDVQSGTVASAGQINISTAGGATTSGTLNLSGAGTTVTQTAANGVTVGHASAGAAFMTVNPGATFNSAGPLVVNGTGTLSVPGGAYNTSSSVAVNSTGGASDADLIVSFSGAFTQTGTSPITVGHATTGTGGIEVNNSGTFTTGTGTTTVNPTGQINISTSGIFNANGDIAIAGGVLQKASGASFNWAANKTMNISAGGDFLHTGSIILTGNVVNVTGAGSSFSTPSSIVSVQTGAQVNLSSGASLTGSQVTAAGGTVTADGVGTTIATTSSSSITSGGAITLSNGASATVPSMTLGNGNAQSATVNVNSGSTLSITSFNVVVGHPTGTNATLNLTGNGLFTTGANSIVTINASGDVLMTGGGTFDANGDVDVNGGTIQDDGTGGGYSLGVGKFLTVQNGGSVTLGSQAFFIQNGQANITGNNSLLSLNGDVFVDGALLIVTGGADVSANAITVGNNFGGTMIVDGAGSTVTGASPLTQSVWGFSNADANLTFSNNAAGSFGTVFLGTGPNEDTVVTVQSGADLTFNNVLKIADVAAPNATGTLTVTGAGASLTSTFAGDALVLGAFSNSTGSLSITDGASLTMALASNTVFNPTGVLNITGGTVQLGGVTYNGGAGINFVSGSLAIQDNLAIGINDVLGPAVTIGAGKTLSISGTTTIDPFRSLTLSGGTLNTGGLVNNNGTFNFTSGTLNVTSGGLTIGSGGPLGSTVTLGAGQTVVVSGGVPTVSSNGLLVMQSGGTLSGASNLSNAGEIQLAGATAQVNVPNLINSKLVLGDGRINASLNNQATGEVRASGSQRLVFNGASHSNSGKINLLNGGTIEFASGQLVNGSAASTISGRGTLIAAAGIVNFGTIQLSGGFSDVFGTLTNSSGGKVIVTGGGTSTFYNNVTANNGTEFRVSTGSTAVFFGDVFGTNNFTGSGTKIFEAGQTTLDQLASVAGDSVVESAAVLTANRIDEDLLVVNGTANITGSAAPASHVNSLSVAGTLNVGAANLGVTGGATLGGGTIAGTSGVVTAGSFAVQGATLDATNAAGTLTFNGPFAGAGSLTKTGPGTATLTGTTSYTGGTNVDAGTLQVKRMHENNAVNVANGAKLVVLDSSPTLPDFPSGDNAFISRPSSLTIAAGGQLDLGNNDLIIDYAGASPIADIEAMIASGFNGGEWDGDGIISTTALNDPNFVLAVAENALLLIPFGDGGAGDDPLFVGQVVDDTTVLVKFTHRVDLDLDGLITGNDAAVFNAFFNEGQPATWQFGDLDYDGVYSGNDAAIFNGFYNESLASVPEPASMAFAAWGLALVRRRRRP